MFPGGVLVDCLGTSGEAGNVVGGGRVEGKRAKGVRTVEYGVEGGEV